LYVLTVGTGEAAFCFKTAINPSCVKNGMRDGHENITFKVVNFMIAKL